MAVAVAALAGFGALLYDPPLQTLTVGQRSFVIPPADVSSRRRGPHLFIRVRPSGKPFELVHDSRLADARDETGVPHIFSVNDQGQHDVLYARDERSIVVCRRASSPAGGCGTWISYGGATWSILFPESRIGDADRFAREGVALLRKYDTRAITLVP
jgi:hypothetical protein